MVVPAPKQICWNIYSFIYFCHTPLIVFMSAVNQGAHVGGIVVLEESPLVIRSIQQARPTSAPAVAQPDIDGDSNVQDPPLTPPTSGPVEEGQVPDPGVCACVCVCVCVCMSVCVCVHMCMCVCMCVRMSMRGSGSLWGGGEQCVFAYVCLTYAWPIHSSRLAQHSCSPTLAQLQPPSPLPLSLQRPLYLLPPRFRMRPLYPPPPIYFLCCRWAGGARPRPRPRPPVLCLAG